VSSKGGAPESLAPPPGLVGFDPSWSQNGLIAFDAVDPKGNYDIYVGKPGSTAAAESFPERSGSACASEST